MRKTVLLVLALSQAACVSKPSMDLYGASVSGATPLGVVVNMRVKVKNTNNFDIEVRNVFANVVVAERYRLPAIRYSPNKWLQSNRSTIMSVPMVVPWTLIGPLLNASLGKSQVTYTVVGTADVTATRALGIEVNDHEIDEEGTISRTELVNAAARGASGR